MAFLQSVLDESSGRSTLNIINEMVKLGELIAPIAITRDHMDAATVASPLETENMQDGSDAIAD